MFYVALILSLFFAFSFVMDIAFVVRGKAINSDIIPGRIFLMSVSIVAAIYFYSA